MNEPEERRCIDCGASVITGVRCRKCHGKDQALQAARDKDEEDREILRLYELLGSNVRLALRLGCSRQRAWEQVRKARERQALLAAVTA